MDSGLHAQHFNCYFMFIIIRQIATGCSETMASIYKSVAALLPATFLIMTHKNTTEQICPTKNVDAIILLAVWSILTSFLDAWV